MSLQSPFEIKCRVCNGAGYHLSAEPPFHERKCGACEGTGHSPEYAELQRDIEAVFTCKHCGAKKVHYRLYGYKCPHRCEDKS